ARAECAWVLWRSTSMDRGPETWRVVHALESRPACDDGIVSQMDILIRSYLPVIGARMEDARKNGDWLVWGATGRWVNAGRDTVLVNLGTGMTSVAFKCLPDTVDLRGVKGGALRRR